MTLFDQLLLQAERWLDRLDRDRDLAARLRLDAWIDQLERERLKHIELIDQLKALQRANHPALLLPRRPTRVLKASLRPALMRREA